jgi:hypothetical protein
VFRGGLTKEAVFFRFFGVSRVFRGSRSKEAVFVSFLRFFAGVLRRPVERGRFRFDSLVFRGCFAVAVRKRPFSFRFFGVSRVFRSGRSKEAVFVSFLRCFFGVSRRPFERGRFRFDSLVFRGCFAVAVRKRPFSFRFFGVSRVFRGGRSKEAVFVSILWCFFGVSRRPVERGRFRFDSLVFRGCFAEAVRKRPFSFRFFGVSLVFRGGRSKEAVFVLFLWCFAGVSRRPVERGCFRFDSLVILWFFGGRSKEADFVSILWCFAGKRPFSFRFFGVSRVFRGGRSKEAVFVSILW